ncbi:MAG: ATP-binding cassette domain-containing protein [Candidatus Gastranaerophilaceae bacterium]|jgi:phospholipid/cholesterol/gamma-HCH transport system ATP-binding protein
METESKNINIVEFKDVCFSFGDKQIFNNLSFEVKTGEILTIVGPSGCGKSTVLKLITGLLQPDCGEIIVRAQKFGMSFQYAALFNSLTVFENIALALKETTKMPQKEINERVIKALKIVELEETVDMYPDELSGGMKKRVSIARALALHPEIILYDEPSTGLDPMTASKLEKDIVRLGKEVNATSIIVTHDIATIKNVSDRVLILDKGHIVWSGTLNEFLTDNADYPSSFRQRKSISEETK